VTFISIPAVLATVIVLSGSHWCPVHLYTASITKNCFTVSHGSLLSVKRFPSKGKANEISPGTASVYRRGKKGTMGKYPEIHGGIP
jgi:hypothetical protein